LSSRHSTRLTALYVTAESRLSLHPRFRGAGRFGSLDPTSLRSSRYTFRLRGLARYCPFQPRRPNGCSPISPSYNRLLLGGDPIVKVGLDRLHARSVNRARRAGDVERLRRDLRVVAVAVRSRERRVSRVSAFNRGIRAVSGSEDISLPKLLLSAYPLAY
jgi:hypothetical protein